MGLFSWLFGSSKQRLPPSPSDFWRISEAGNPTYLGPNHTGKTVRATVFPDEGQQRFWKFVVTRIDADGFDSDRHEPFYSGHYFTSSNALADCKRYLSGVPLQERTYQQERHERMAEEAAVAMPSVIESERKRLDDLKARVARGRSKKENLLRAARQRLSQATHYRNYFGMAGRPSSGEIAALDDLVSAYELLIQEITQSAHF